MGTLKIEKLCFGHIKAPMLFLDINVQKNCGLVFLFGQSGVGKTTFLELICGIQDLFAGKILIDNRPPKDATNVISYIPSQPVFLKNKTVIENLEFACDAIGVSHEKIDQKDEWIITHAKTKAKKLSKIDQFVLCFKRAKIKDSKLFLVDINLDNLTETDTQNYLKALDENLRNDDKLAIISMSSNDFKKLQNWQINSEIWYIFAQNLQKFDNFSSFEKNISNLEMAKYCDYNFSNAKIKSSINGYFLELENLIVKIYDEMVKNIASYFEIEQTADVIIAQKENLKFVSQSQVLDAIQSGSLLVFDKLSGELLK